MDTPTHEERTAFPPPPKGRGIHAEEKMTQIGQVAKKEKPEQNPWVPVKCFACRYLTSMPVAEGVTLHFCGHPKSFQIKGGMLAVDPMDDIEDDCPFKHYEEKYKNKPIRRWFMRLWLRRAKRVDPRGNK